MSWEPDQRELADATSIRLTEVDRYQAVGRLYVKKYRAHLASQCGDDPCKGCDQGVCLGNPEEIGCDARTFYKGMIAQAAKGQQLLQAREREIVAELQRLREDAKIHLDLGEDTTYNQGRIDVTHCLEQHLGLEGK